MDTNTDSTLNSVTPIAAGKPVRTRKSDAKGPKVAVASALPRESQSQSTPAAQSKSAVVIKLLSRSRGASGAELAEATGWQPHTVRAYLSGLRKKGMTLVREARKSGETGYRIVAAPVAAKPDVADTGPPPATASGEAADDDNADVDVGYPASDAGIAPATVA